jgi:hypothetical protein
MRIHLDMNRIFLGAEHLYLRHAADLGYALGDPCFGVFIERVEGQRRRSQRQVEDRLIRRVDLRESRRRRHPLRQQTPGLCDGSLHIHSGAIQVATQIEFERNLRGTERIRGRHRIQSRDH